MKAMHRRRQILQCALVGACLPAAAQGSRDAALQAVIDGPHRSPANRARDAARHPLQTLNFFGLEPGHRVVELAPGSGWYTEIVAPFLRPHGRLHVAHPAADSAQEERRRSRARFESWLAQSPDLYHRVVMATLPSAGAFGDVPRAADLVLTFRNVHNWIEEGVFDALLRACHAVLKPGGVLGVVDHRAAPGTPLEKMISSGYVTEALMEERAVAAGFTRAARSEINANPRDSKDHVNGVWSLPPSLRGKELERERFLAIGESDRFTHRYLKPRG